jgi:hypothetical protein
MISVAAHTDDASTSGTTGVDLAAYNTPNVAVVSGVEAETTPTVQSFLTPTGGDEGEITIDIRKPKKNEWAAGQERRFDALVQREALGTITEDEQTELEHLDALRSALKIQRTGEEILFEQQLRTATRKLVEALGNYVHICERESKAV